MTPVPRSNDTGPAFPLGLLFLVCLVLAWSWIGAADRMTWWLESFPALIALPVLGNHVQAIPIHAIGVCADRFARVHFISWRALHL